MKYENKVLIVLIIFVLLALLSNTTKNYDKGYTVGLEEQNTVEDFNNSIWSRSEEVCDMRIEKQKQLLLTLAYSYDEHRKIIIGLLCEKNCDKTRDELYMDFAFMGNSGESGSCDWRLKSLVEEAKDAPFSKFGNICY